MRVGHSAKGRAIVVPCVVPAPLIDAENLFRQPGPPLNARRFIGLPYWGSQIKLEQRVSGKAHKNHIRVPESHTCGAACDTHWGNGAPVCEFHN